MTCVPLIAGNWKMHLNHLEAIQLVQKLSYELASHDYAAAQVSVHPPFTALRSIQTVIDADRLEFKLGAQDCHSEKQGAFTGDVSAEMLAKLDVAYVIVGHSERRASGGQSAAGQVVGESDELVAAKTAAVVAKEMLPIVCVGETLDERESGRAQEVVGQQLRGSLATLKKAAFEKLVVAYEPVWAIGTGATASPQDAQEMCAYVRSIVDEIAVEKRAGSSGELVRVLYGGSVKSENARSLLVQPDIDGALVGGASLDAQQFARIIKAAQPAS